jgi:hypothetical protein
MKTHGLARILGLAALFLGLGLNRGLDAVQAQPYYKVGDTVTNFTLYTRRQWTNQTGRVFVPGTPLQLSDFAGSIVFLEFFDPT